MIDFQSIVSQRQSASKQRRLDTRPFRYVREEASAAGTGRVPAASERPGGSGGPPAGSEAARSARHGAMQAVMRPDFENGNPGDAAETRLRQRRLGTGGEARRGGEDTPGDPQSTLATLRRPPRSAAADAANLAFLAALGLVKSHLGGH